ncbi:MAG: hypothetical protein AAB618_01075 [Patescibacteria group bacterium]
MKHVQRLQLNTKEQTLILLTLLAVFVGVYLYFLNLSVVHVVMRKETLAQHNQIRTEIAQLETSYIEAQHKIAGRIAYLDGYSIDTAKIFVTRGQDSLVLRDN